MRQLCLTVTNLLSLQCFKLRSTLIQPPPIFAEPLISTLGLSRYNRYWTYLNVLLESKSSFYPEILFFKAPICEKVDCWVLFWVHEILKLWIALHHKALESNQLGMPKSNSLLSSFRYSMSGISQQPQLGIHYSKYRRKRGRLKDNSRYSTSHNRDKCFNLKLPLPWNLVQNPNSWVSSSTSVTMRSRGLSFLKVKKVN